jgi:HD-GYP domain-containing protein (c-di-GMP phosphodiesterase class II)
MLDPTNGIDHLKIGQAIEKTSFNGLSLSLLASADGTEVIHHKLFAGSRWALGPEIGWNALEFVFILSGELISSDGKLVVKAGESISMAPIKKDVFFTVRTETDFIYVSSRPMFYNYSNIVREMMDLAVSVEQKDGYTADHCNRIMKYSMLVGECMSLSPNNLYDLNLGSFLHDIGKTKVPSNILNKPGKLTNKEWEIMKKHTIFGRKVLEKTNFPSLISASLIVEQHHERFNGSGYPYGFKDNKISIGASIVAVVDSYDAMTTNRVYSMARKKEEALEEIEKGRDTLYHPEVVDAFLSISNRIN